MSCSKPATFLALGGNVENAEAVIGAHAFCWSIRPDKHERDCWCIFVPGTHHVINLFHGSKDVRASMLAWLKMIFEHIPISYAEWDEGADMAPLRLQ